MVGGPFEERPRRRSCELRKCGFQVDLVVLNDTPPGLSRAVITRGRRVFCADAEADHAFVRDTLLRAADLEPWLQRMRRIKLDA